MDIINCIDGIDSYYTIAIEVYPSPMSITVSSFNFQTYSRCVLYLASRVAPDFAALVQIMSDLKKRDPGYTPLTMLDFGSGVGSGMW